jgi:hypothetical protein
MEIAMSCRYILVSLILSSSAGVRAKLKLYQAG